MAATPNETDLARDLGESQARFRAIAESAPVGIFLTDVDGEITYSNPMLARLTGLTPEQIRVGLMDAVHPDDRDQLARVRERMVAERVPCSCRGRFVQGADDEVHWRAQTEPVTVDGTFRGHVATVIDQTGEVERARELAESEGRYRRLIEVSDVLVLEFDLEGRVTYANPAIERILGYAPSEVIGEPSFSFLPSEGVRVARERLERAVGGEPIPPREVEAKTKTGERRLISFTPAVIRDPQGRVCGVSGTGVDVTDRVYAQAKLESSKERYRKLVETSDVIVFELDLDGRIVFVNSAVEKVLGYEPESMVGEMSHGFIAADNTERFDERLLAVRGGENVAPYLLTVQRRDGSAAALRVAWASVRHRDGNAIVITGTAVDVTDLEQMRSELAATVANLQETDFQRRALVRRLLHAEEEQRARIAGEIHDQSIQTLSASRLRLGLLAEALEDPEQRSIAAEIEAVLRQATRELRDLVFELRPPILEESGIVAALREHLDQFHDLTGIAIELNSRTTSEPDPTVAAIAYRVCREALSNVRRHSSATTVTVELSGREGQLAIAIRDDGRGFDSAEPSAAGHIGLASMKERVESAGGSFRLESAPGAGTTVEFELPLAIGG